MPANVALLGKDGSQVDIDTLLLLCIAGNASHFRIRGHTHMVSDRAFGSRRFPFRASSYNIFYMSMHRGSPLLSRNHIIGKKKKKRKEKR